MRYSKYGDLDNKLTFLATLSATTIGVLYFKEGLGRHPDRLHRQRCQAIGHGIRNRRTALRESQQRIMAPTTGL